MRRRLRRLGASTLTIAAVLAVLGAPAHADPTTGTITGQVTDAGAPVADAAVFAFDSPFTIVNSARTGPDGRYTIADLPPGEYMLQFEMADGRAQWAHQKEIFDEPDRFAVTAGQTTVVDEVLFPTGTLTGILTDGSGPVAGVAVAAQPVSGDARAGFTTTDADGRFTLRLRAADFRLEFQLESFATQYHPGQLDPDRATPLTITAGAQTDVAETLLPTGSVGGRLVEDGAPVANANLSWHHTNGITSAFVQTDADGRYALARLFAGDYRVHVQLPDQRSQWARGKLDQDAADIVAVTAGAQTVLDETVLPTGRVLVRATDSRDGSPVSGFCAEIRDVFTCTETDLAEFAKVPAGRHTVTVFPNNDELLIGGGTVEVTAGDTAEVSVPLTPAGLVTTTIRDRATGAPVEGACLNPVRLVQASFPDGDQFCSDASGAVRVRITQPGTYTLFASVHDDVHGAQWVGAYGGGTGDQFQARRVHVALGQRVTLPPVLLDRAGSVSGRVTDRATGAPVGGALVSLLTSHPAIGPTGPHTQTGPDGRYTLGGLGPYHWPLRYASSEHAAQWSGGAQSRLLATPVKVTAGGTATANVRLGKGTTVRGTITAGGAPVLTLPFVVAYDAVLGDIAGATFSPDGSYSMRVLGPTGIRIRVQDGRDLDRWHRDAADFGHATVVLVPAGGTKTVNLAFR